MATYRKQLQDQNGNIIVPAMPAGSITGTDIANNTVGSNNLDWTTLKYKPGDTIDYRQYDIVFPGRQQISGTTKRIRTWVPVDKPITSGSTITFTPTDYIEAFDHTGVLFSFQRPDSSKVTFDCSVPNTIPNMIRVTLTITNSGTTIHHNTPCVVTLYGKFNVS